MPKLKLHMQDGGARFNAHVADAPQCGPSRSSTLTGRAVHNTKFYINSDPTQASFVNYAQIQNQTFGTFLTEAGYHTAFLGKYGESLQDSSSLLRSSDPSELRVAFSQRPRMRPQSCVERQADVVVLV